MEKKLDNVEAGSDSRRAMLNAFYAPFMKEVETAMEVIKKESFEPTGEMCPECGKPLVYKDGKNGKFIGCSNYPACRYVKKEPKVMPTQTGENCPLCGKPLVERTDKKGRTFVACSGYPKCRYVKQEEKVEIDPKKIVKPCPKCNGSLIKKRGKFGYFLGCTNYPTCNYMEKINRRKKQ